MKLHDIFKLSTIQDLQNLLKYLENQYAETIYQHLLNEPEAKNVNIDFPLNLKNLCVWLFNENNITLLNEFIDQMGIDYGAFQTLNISKMVAQVDNIKKPFTKENIEAIKIYLGFDLLFKTAALAQISEKEKKLITDLKQYHRKKLFNKKTISQSAIAKEWEIDNDTLSKWFIAYYGINKFEGRKGLNLNEYIEIHRNFFNSIIDEELVEKNLIALPEHMDNFISCVTFKGKVYEKKDIIELGFNIDDPNTSYYEQAKIILDKKFTCYSKLNKFYHSITVQMIEELKKHT